MRSTPVQGSNACRASRSAWSTGLSPPDGAGAPGAGSLFWVSDTGVRYGIDNEAENGPGQGKTVAALGLNPPAVPIPWSMLSLFAPGPALSRADALLSHDGLMAEGGIR